MTYRKPDCTKCLDVGIVELVQGDFTTLARCICDQGRKQTWDLPKAPMRGYREQPLDWREYKSQSPRGSEQKIAWNLERIRTAEQFWKEQLKESDPEDAA